ncbi:MULTISPECIES: bifunctional 2-polyprenyl-6-hydroxyphenol methylase/3-demethylubiquinol 3-O-methyltransferase UbiG [unclassified Caballeronia]|uniref:class I SAM-dependent methyltransferase n=1 Tax=unclassified Caballeronia TaxID=2646786 RepID=UPI001F17673E|nr:MULTISPECIES: class I SAM-dependent methyltransferase [unclassified Caballeronia]MCE4540912.1 class I SAM-dependent methyltransferase [Caballeronia sp. PC1]MCE4570045.1 class I SAM-dependent methyltransferase [Caballeronia sp. CLC5]
MDRPAIFEKLNAIAERKGDIFAALRELPLDVVADALLEIPSQYAAARAALPTMAADSVQDAWTGNHGHTLLFQSAAFARAVESGFFRHTGRLLDGATVLDYGCGWGRLLRLMYKFTEPARLYGCDPWSASIDLCKEYKVAANLAVCDYVPDEVPFPDVRFDLIYAFSVFTHLSEKTAISVLRALRKSLAPDGLLAVTIRPDSYWYVHNTGSAKADTDLMRRLHRENKYAFTPHHVQQGVGAVDADGLNTYGDASFSFDYLRTHWPDWEFVGYDVCLLDPYQTIIFLKPREPRAALQRSE